ncbi:MAG: response regulator [Chitinophagaceae bacterium]|nr:response regulator [Chitinophagaceae bacterium]
MHIILLEDDPAINDSMVLILEMAGYEVSPFLSVESFRQANLAPPDVYLLDRQINDDDGLILCRELKDDNLTAHVPIIMISASQNIAALLYEAGGDAFLEKPYSRQKLIAIIERVIRRCDYQ